MGNNFLGGLFGGGQQSVEPVSYDPVPVRENEKEAESAAVRDEERRRLRSRRSMSGTILTSPLGVAGQSSAGQTGTGQGLLGRNLQ